MGVQLTAALGSIRLLRTLSRIIAQHILGRAWGEVDNLLSDEPVLQLFAQPHRCMLSGIDQQRASCAMLEDRDVSGLLDQIEVRTAWIVAAEHEDVVSHSLHLCGIGHAVSFENRTKTQHFAVLPQQILDPFSARGVAWHRVDDRVPG